MIEGIVIGHLEYWRWLMVGGWWRGVVTVVQRSWGRIVCWGVGIFGGDPESGRFGEASCGLLASKRLLGV